MTQIKTTFMSQYRFKKTFVEMPYPWAMDLGL